ncbi:hypothetical protein [Streptomyces sp. NPDC056982]|uniref:hypothetical protein n=1 Tax=Streptomyces sp. NPDC056982 TaxID=3345986 RepID=UPI003625F430
MADNLVGKSQQDGISGVYGGNEVNGNGVVALPVSREQRPMRLQLAQILSSG